MPARRKRIQLKRVPAPQCEYDGCQKEAKIVVSDGPHGLSPEVNRYYLCLEHRPPPFAFENERKV